MSIVAGGVCQMVGRLDGRVMGSRMKSGCPGQVAGVYVECTAAALGCESLVDSALIPNEKCFEMLLSQSPFAALVRRRHDSETTLLMHHRPVYAANLDDKGTFYFIQC